MSTLARSTTRVMILDDHALFAESLAMTLEVEGFNASRVEVPNEGSLPAVLATILRHPPRIVLLDLDLGRLGDGIRLIEPLTKAGCSVIVITGSRERTRWGECLLRGATKVMAKTVPLKEVVGTVRRIHDGLPVISRDERQELIQCWHLERVETVDLRARLNRLTRREQEILGQLMLGKPVRAIARDSVVSEATVRTQVKSILAKLEMTSQLAAVGAAYKVGWHVPLD